MVWRVRRRVAVEGEKADSVDGELTGALDVIRRACALERRARVTIVIRGPHELPIVIRLHVAVRAIARGHPQGAHARYVCIIPRRASANRRRECDEATEESGPSVGVGDGRKGARVGDGV